MAKKADGEKGPNKMALVRDAVKELGGDAKPQAIHAHILTATGHDIPNNVISSYKSLIKGKSGTRGKKRGRPGRPPKALSAGGSGGGGGSGGSVKLVDLEAVKTLIDRVGASELKTLIGVLVK